MVMVESNYMSVIERFMKFVSPEPNTGCWLWTGFLDRRGYGRFGINRTSRFAHRISYELHVGAIPDGLTLDHLCRVPCCVNPAHLEAVTMRVNCLRGVGPAAKNVLKIQCPRGHEYNSANTKMEGRKRRCRICRRRERNERRARRAA